MRDRKLKNSQLDAAGRQLFVTAKLTEAEIDRIAAGPALFDGVLARISAEAKTVQEPRAVAAPAFMSAYKAVLGTTLAGVLCVGVFAIYLQQNAPAPVSKVIDIP